MTRARLVFYWVTCVPIGLLMLAAMLVGEVMFAGQHDNRGRR